MTLLIGTMAKRVRQEIGLKQVEVAQRIGLSVGN